MQPYIVLNSQPFAYGKRYVISVSRREIVTWLKAQVSDDNDYVIEHAGMSSHLFSVRESVLMYLKLTWD